jgi:hypothetical protein
MIALLTSRLGIGAIGIVGVVLMYIGWTMQVNNLRTDHATTLATERALTSKTQKGWDDYKLLVEQQIANQERIRANENARLLSEHEAMAAEIDRLRIASAALRRQRDEESQSLVRILNNAQPSDVRELGAAVLAYLDGVRRGQAAARATGGPSAWDRPACERVSGNQFRCSLVPSRTALAR